MCDTDVIFSKLNKNGSYIIYKINYKKILISNQTKNIIKNNLIYERFE